MGVGGSLQAAFTGLAGPLAAGPWTLFCDGVVAGTNAMSMHVHFDIVWRAAQATADGGAGVDGGAEQILVSFQHTYVLDPNHATNAISYMESAVGLPAAARPGDQLILRWTVDSGDPGGYWEPNGDGVFRSGVLPHIILPH